MKNLLVFVFCILVSSCLGVKSVIAQSSQEDASANLSLENAKRIFISTVKDQSRLFNGPSYYTYGNNVNGSAIFLDTTFLKGTIVYEGIKYNDVPLMYDLYIDRLVSVVDGEAYSLITERVSEFEIGQHLFKYFDFENSVNKAPLAPGFFEVLYDGKITVMAKHIEKLGISTNLEKPYFFRPSTSYLLLMGDKYIKFTDEGSLINALNKNKKEMKKQLQQANVKFSANPKDAIGIIARYYDSLAN